MTVQRTQHSSCICAAAAKTGLHRNALDDADLQAIGIFADGVKIQLRSLPGQIGLIGGNIILITKDVPGLAGADVNLDIIPQGDGLHDALDIVVTVFPLTQHVQG